MAGLRHLCLALRSVRGITHLHRVLACAKDLVICALRPESRNIGRQLDGTAMGYQGAYYIGFTA